jgi:hypothetical protein
MTDDPFDDLLRDAARSYNQPPETPRELMWTRIESARAAGAAPVAIHIGRTRWLRTAAGIAAVLLAGIVIGRLTSSPGGTGAGAAPTQVARAGSGMRSPSTVDSTDEDAPPQTVDRQSVDDDQESSVATGRKPSVGGERATQLAMGGRPGAGDARSSYNVPRQRRGAVGDGTEMNVYRLAVVEHLARTEVLLTGFRSQAREGTTSARTAGQQFAVLSRELLQNTRLLLATHATDDPILTRLLEDLELVLMQISQYAEEGRHGDLDAINQSLDRRNVLPKLRSTIPAGAPVPAGT